MASKPKKAPPASDWEDEAQAPLPDDWEDKETQASAPAEAEVSPSVALPESEESPSAEPTSQSPPQRTFYVQDTNGDLRPISYENALRANEMGLKVLSEAEVLALRSAPQRATPPAPSSPPKDPGLARTLGRGLLQGFFKQGADEASGALARVGTELGPNAQYRMPDGTMRRLGSGGDVYRAVRDTEREIERGAREHRPKTAFLANMAGDLASDAVLSAFGVPVVSTPYQVASGALSGLLGSDAELSTDDVSKRDAVRAAEAAGVGGVMGYYLPKIGTQVARALPGTMARLRQAFEGSALDKARKVLTSGADQMSNRRPVSDAAAREALDSEAIPIWGTTEGAFKRLELLAGERGERYADIIDRLDKLGVRGPEVEPLAQRLLQRADDYAKNSGADKAVANAFAAEANNVRAIAPREFAIVGESPMALQRAVPTPPVTAPKVRITPPRDPVSKRFLPKSKWPKDWGVDASPAPVVAAPSGPPTPQPITPKMLDQPIPGPQGSRLPLTQAELIKRDLQAKAKYGRREDTLLNEARKGIASDYREGIERAVEEAGSAAPSGSEVAGLAQEFRPVKQQLARTLEARDAAERGAARSAQRVGGAAGVNLFDVANASQATGSKGIPALMWAMAQRAWKERGPSTMANIYDVGAEAAGNLSKWSLANPEKTAALARYLAPPLRQFAASDAAENLFVPSEELVAPMQDQNAAVQRAIADYLLQRQQQ